MMPPENVRTVCDVEDVGRDGLQSRESSSRKHPGAGFHWTVLQRHGRRPLAILGRAVLQANNRCAGLPRWSEVCVYETAAGRFAASLRHPSCRAADPVWCDGWLCDSPEAVRSTLRSHDPLVALPCFPVVWRPGSASRGTFGPGELHLDLTELTDGCHVADRFLGAWAGLLAAMFGFAPTRQDIA